MSYQVGSQCFSSAGSALQSMSASMFGGSVGSDGSPISFHSYVDGSSIVTVSSLGYSSSITPVLPDCQLIDISDAAIYSWSVFAVLAVVWKFRAIISALHMNRTGD